MPAPNRACTLFLPALFSAAPAPVAATTLETVLARGRALTPLAVGFESTLYDLFGVPNDTSPAAVARLGEATSPEPNKAWMRADPVYLQLDGARMRLLGSMPLRLTVGEAHALAQELAPVFSDVPARLEVLHPERWYLALDVVPNLENATLAVALGGDVDTHLPRGGDARAWRRRMNETQMVLHTSEVNAARETRGELPVNSLWFWGAGKAPVIPAARWSQVFSEEPLSRGLARLSSTPAHDLPRDGAEWLAEARTPGEHLLVIGDAYETSLHLAEPGARVAWLERVEQEWLRPLVAALRGKELSSLSVVGNTGLGVRATTADLGRWWRRRRGLATYIS